MRSTVTSRPERSVEPTVYFAVAELLANVAKHARATEMTVELGYVTRMLTATATDDGRGGAAASEDSGLARLERGAAAFGGRLPEIYSLDPAGPTRDRYGHTQVAYLVISRGPARPAARCRR